MESDPSWYAVVQHAVCLWADGLASLSLVGQL